jgi:hypothetical protein
MKSLLISLLAILLLASCQNERSPSQQSEPVDTEAESPPSVAESEKTLDVPWIAVFNDSTTLLEMKKNPAARPENLTGQDIIDALNLKYPQIRIDSFSVEGNKAIVSIQNSTYLTQEMGTAGARAYLAEATYSLTEIDDIKAVDFRFKAGDHAMPGILTRRSFENFN